MSECMNLNLLIIRGNMAKTNDPLYEMRKERKLLKEQIFRLLNAVNKMSKSAQREFYSALKVSVNLED
jgi:hypothetical protein